MKKIFLSLALVLAFGFTASAQEDIKENPTEEAAERLNQETPRPEQRANENAAMRSATTDEQNKKQAEILKQQQIREQAQQKNKPVKRKKATPANQKTKIQ